jgi:hypothetical protein
LNTAFQIGSGVALAISAATTEAVDIEKGHAIAQQYSTGFGAPLDLQALASLLGLSLYGDEESAHRTGLAIL